MSGRNEFLSEFEKLYNDYKLAQYNLALGEEITGKKYFGGVVNELRAVLHHTLESYEYYKTQEISNDGIYKWKKEFIKAREEHLMRAVIDSYDICFNGIKTNIRQVYEKYETADVVAIFPDFHLKILPFFIQLNRKTAEFRTTRSSKLIYDLQEDLTNLIDRYYHEFIVGVPLIEKHLEEKNEKEKKRLEEERIKEIKAKRFTYIMTLSSLIIGAVSSYIVSKYLSQISAFLHL